jgi:hypothetical protein
MNFPKSFGYLFSFAVPAEPGLHPNAIALPRRPAQSGRSKLKQNDNFARVCGYELHPLRGSYFLDT